MSAIKEAPQRRFLVGPWARGGIRLGTHKRQHASGGEEEVPMVSGYAAVFYSDQDPGTEYQLYPDLVERIMPGCFDRAIRDNDDVVALVNHDPNQLLGRTDNGTCRLAIDSRGLRFEVDPPDTTAAADMLKSLKRGDVGGCSFSFDVEEQSWQDVKDAEGRWRSIRNLTSVRLYDISVVLTHPAYKGTTVGMGRAAGQDGEQVRFERDAWRKEQARGREERERALRLAAGE